MAGVALPEKNKVIVSGNLTKDPIFRQTTNSTPVVKFSIASNRKYKDSSNQWQFFQAEVGIRAYKVTGVQTCALPIYSRCGAGLGRLWNQIHAPGNRLPRRGRPGRGTSDDQRRNSIDRLTAARRAGAWNCERTQCARCSQRLISGANSWRTLMPASTKMVSDPAMNIGD